MLIKTPLVPRQGALRQTGHLFCKLAFSAVSCLRVDVASPSRANDQGCEIHLPWIEIQTMCWGGLALGQDGAWGVLIFSKTGEGVWPWWV